MKLFKKKKDFNCTKNNQFTTWLALSGENMEVVLQTKLLGTIIKKNTSNETARQLTLKKDQW